MKRTLTLGILVLALIATALPLYAQGGGGGRRRGGSEPSTKTEFEDPDIRFSVPPDVSLFTPDAPGRFGDVFKPGIMAYLVNLIGKDINIAVRTIPGVSEADLKQMQQRLETDPPQAKQPGFKKLSLGGAQIGSKSDKDAVSYVFTVNNAKKDPVTTRQVSFMHNGKGFIITCVAPEKEFASVDKKTFDALFQKMLFK